MKLTGCGHSKKAVLRAGETLIDEDISIEQRWLALEVLSDWRSSHAYPTHALLIFLRSLALKTDGYAVVVRRLKRTPSILNKLTRFPDMKLHRMQDIGGCRAVVGTARHVAELMDSILKSRTKHELHKVYDYIETPKSSGYRGVHLVFKYRGAKQEFDGIFIEIQLRSKVQHSWATAVEVVDFFTNQALKASRGEDEWLQFFKYAGAEFAKFEHRPVSSDLAHIDTAFELKRLAASLSVIERLNAFAVTTQHVVSKTNSKTDYFLLELVTKENLIKVRQFSSSDLSKATRVYLERETEAKGSHDVVLVAAGSMHALKAAYPNYFADTSAFIQNLKKVLAGRA